MTRNPQVPRSGFTLVELLVTMTIIAILASVVLGALYASQEAARERSTRSTIAKLHTRIMERWDSYRSRRIQLARGSSESTQEFAARQLVYRWELMRFEMPDRYTDINGYSPPSGIGTSKQRQALANNAMRFAYASFVQRTRNPSVPPERENTNAECLYMTVAIGMNPGEEVRFLAGEVGDTDNDGFPEFLDGWNRPISWLRWAPGFTPNFGANTDFQLANPQRNPDPLDPLGVGRPPATALQPTGPPPPLPARFAYGYALTPLIFSAGGDGEFGLHHVRDDEQPKRPLSEVWSPYVTYPDAGGTYRLLGTPISGAEGGGHLDNPHNHQLGLR